MAQDAKTSERGLLARWFYATTLGWLLGFALVLVLAMLWDLIGGGAQFMVGLGMGLGVGILQSRVLRSWGGSARGWLWASTLGMAAPFAVWDLAAMLGFEAGFSLLLCGLAGGLLAGLGQLRQLGPRFQRHAWWIPVSVLGWGLPLGLMALGESTRLPGAWNLLTLAPMFLGGTLLGAIGGAALRWMKVDSASAS